MSNCKCIWCEVTYDIEMGKCPACGKRGGFMQEPKCVQLGELNIHLEEILVHSPSGNEYQIKEIQMNGLIAKMVKCPLPVPLVTKAIYISNTTINEYKRK